MCVDFQSCRRLDSRPTKRAQLRLGARFVALRFDPGEYEEAPQCVQGPTKTFRCEVQLAKTLDSANHISNIYHKYQ